MTDYEETDDPDIMDKQIGMGLICSGCCKRFVKEHGFPVVCSDCLAFDGGEGAFAGCRPATEKEE